MFESLDNLEAELHGLVKALDPHSLTPVEAADALHGFAVLARIATTGLTRLADRAGACTRWRQRDFPDIGSWVADELGATAYDGRRLHAASTRPDLCPDTWQLMASGTIAPLAGAEIIGSALCTERARAAALARAAAEADDQRRRADEAGDDAADADLEPIPPVELGKSVEQVERDLLDVATDRTGTIRRLRQERDKAEAAARDEAQSAIHAFLNRSISFSPGHDGMGEARVRLDNGLMAVVRAILDANADKLFRQGGRGANGRAPSNANLLADALVLLLAGRLPDHPDGLQPGPTRRTSTATSTGPPETSNRPRRTGPAPGAPPPQATASIDTASIDTAPIDDPQRAVTPTSAIAPVTHRPAHDEASGDPSQPSGASTSPTTSTPSASGLQTSRGPVLRDESTEDHHRDDQRPVGPPRSHERSDGSNHGAEPLAVIVSDLRSTDGDPLPGELALDLGPDPETATVTVDGDAAPAPVAATGDVVVRVHASALARGVRLPGEDCEIVGAGPISVADARRLAAHACTDVVIRDDGRITTVACTGRRLTRHLHPDPRPAPPPHRTRLILLLDANAIRGPGDQLHLPGTGLVSRARLLDALPVAAIETVAACAVDPDTITTLGRTYPRPLSVAVRETNPHCPRCGFERWLQTDHVLALALGGRTTRTNLSRPCAWCHATKTRAEAPATIRAGRRRAQQQQPLPPADAEMPTRPGLRRRRPRTPTPADHP